MADITLCHGFAIDENGIHDCKIRNSCKRFITKGEPLYQSYTTPGSDFDVGHGCEYLWLVDPF